MMTVKIEFKNDALAHKINEAAPGGTIGKSIMRIVASSMLGVIKTRIHEEGKASDGTPIGTHYSTKEMWASKSQFVGSGFKPQGKVKVGSEVKAGTNYKTLDTLYYSKDGERKLKKQKTAVKGNSSDATNKQQLRRTMYLADGYEEFRRIQGRRVDTVNLSLSGQLNNQLVVIPTQTGYGIGWQNTEFLNRAYALEKKYKKLIWALTENENKLAADVAGDEVTKLL